MSTDLRVIDAETIKRLAPPVKLIGWMREAMQLVSARDVELPLRRGMALPDGAGAIGMMPGYVGGEIAAAGVKLVSLVPPDRRKGSSHLGLMILYDADGLVPKAILCGSTVTAIRTAAVTAVATDALARADARSLLILGAGEQAEAHIEVLRLVRPFDDIRVWARRPDQAETLAQKMGVSVARDLSSATRSADVICTTTAAKEPVLFGADVRRGTHVNLVGSSAADAREVDDELVAKSRFVVDYRPSTLDQAGEFLHAINAGVIDENHIVGEIGEVLSGKIAARQSAADITVYKSLGVAAQDIVTAHNVVALALAEDAGISAHI
jgi:ornithine cyclodeaminase